MRGKTMTMDNEPQDPEAEAKPLRRTGARMTHTELKSMRAVQTKEDAPAAQVIKGVQGFWANLVSSLSMVLPTKKHSSCDVNGHVFPKGSWEGDYPRCTHCGEQITTADQFGGRR